MIHTEGINKSQRMERNKSAAWELYVELILKFMKKLNSRQVEKFSAITNIYILW